MATLTFYNFAKRHNSTASPTGAGTDFDVTLKERTDLLQPVFLLNYSGTPAWSYAAYQGRYYFVTGYESVHNDLWYVHCDVDVLATYKSAIQGSSAFVLYDTTTNTEIIDTRLSLKTTESTMVEESSFTTIGTGVCAIVTCVGVDATTTYKMGISDAVALMQGLDTWLQSAIPDPSTGSGDASEAIDELATMTTEGFRQLIATGSAKDCIRSATLVPFPTTSGFNVPRRLWLGGFDTGKTFSRIPNGGAGRILTDEVTVQIPWQATDWRRNNPYHLLYLYIPYIGYMRLPVADLIGAQAIKIKAAMDMMTGDTTFRVYTYNKTIAQYQTTLGVPFTIGSANVTPMQTANALLSGAGAAAAGVGSLFTGNVGGALSSGIAGIQGIMNNLEPMPTCVGSHSGGAVFGLDNKAYCISVFHDTNVLPDSISAICGTPAREVKSLSSLSGYVQTVGASVAGSMTDTERTRINQMLDGGIYIE